MGSKSAKLSTGILVSLLALACHHSPAVLSRIGNVGTIIIVVVLATILARYSKRDMPFNIALPRAVNENQGMVLLLGWFFLGTIVAGFRGGFGILFEWKLHLMSILALVYGFFLSQNPRYYRYSIYLVAPVMLYHAAISNQYVSVADRDMRSALVDLASGLGHTDYWTNYAMLTLLLVGTLIDERNMILKVIGFLMAAYFYKTILLCGFATPVALFLIAHAVLGAVALAVSKKRGAQMVLRLGLAVMLVAGSWQAVQRIARTEGNTRYASIQWRFNNILQNPESGGYTVENSRFEIARYSWESFKKAPILGWGGTYLSNPHSGGHQALFDYLAIYGLLGGGGVFILFTCLCVRNTFLRCRHERTWIAYASFACAVMYLLVGIVNPGWFGGPMTTLLLYALPYKRSPFLTRPPVSSAFQLQSAGLGPVLREPFQGPSWG